MHEVYEINGLLEDYAFKEGKAVAGGIQGYTMSSSTRF